MAVYPEKDNGVTNFHFEITADLLNEEELELLESMRPGLVQLEIGVQSVNPETLQAIQRSMDFEKLAGIVRRLGKNRNIHQHLISSPGCPGRIWTVLPGHLTKSTAWSHLSFS